MSSASATFAPFALLFLLVVIAAVVATAVLLCKPRNTPPAPPPPGNPMPPTQVALCPNCGTPVVIAEGRWQCPKCGSGDVLLTPPQQ